jgi:hypothetical protein
MQRGCGEGRSVETWTKRANLDKTPSTSFSQEPCLGLKGKFEVASQVLGEPSFRLLEMCAERLPRINYGRAGWVDDIRKLQQFNEFATAMALFHQSMDLAAQQVDAGQQADYAAALIFTITGEGRMHGGLRRQLPHRGGNRLDPWLLVIGDDRNPVAGLLLRCRRGFLEDFDSAVNVQHFRQLIFEFGIAAFYIAKHFVRLDLLLIGDLAYRDADQLVDTFMGLGRVMLASLEGQKPKAESLGATSRIWDRGPSDVMPPLVDRRLKSGRIQSPATAACPDKLDRSYVVA